MTQALDLFPETVVATPAAKRWYDVRLTGFETITSPTQGPMFRLRGEIQAGACVGMTVWKPLTSQNFKGIEWCERSLRACGVTSYRLIKIRGAAGLGRYLEGLLAELVSLGAVQVTLYAFTHPTDGIYWTIRTMRKAT